MRTYKKMDVENLARAAKLAWENGDGSIDNDDVFSSGGVYIYGDGDSDDAVYVLDTQNSIGTKSWAYLDNIYDWVMDEVDDDVDLSPVQSSGIPLDEYMTKGQ